MSSALAQPSSPSHVPAQQSALSEVRACLPRRARPRLPSIREKIRAHVRFLSLDLLEGPRSGHARRRAGRRVHRHAVRARRPRARGRQRHLLPARSALRRAHHRGQDQVLVRAGERRRQSIWPTAGRLLSKDQTGQPTADIDAPIVFVGYGIHAPEYNWDDYAGVDVKGKIALVIVNEPPSDDEKFFKGKALTYYGRWTYKYEEAARRGAVGRADHSSHRSGQLWLGRGAEFAGHREELSAGRSRSPRCARPRGFSTTWRRSCSRSPDWAISTRRSTAPASAASTRVELAGAAEGARREPRAPLRLDQRRRARAGRQRRPENAVLYTAHYDHLGIDPDAKGDNIYNGAADNGTGCGILLEMARAFAQSAERPPHADVLCRGHRGGAGPAGLAISRHASAGARARDHARSELRHAAAHRHSALGEPGRRRAHRLLAHGPDGGEGLRSGVAARPRSVGGPLLSHRSFFAGARGHSGVLVDQGELFEGHDEAWGHAQFEDYVAHHYHQPSDEYHADWDFRGNAKLARFGFVLGWLASEQAKPVEWQAGR